MWLNVQINNMCKVHSWLEQFFRLGQNRKMTCMLPIFGTISNWRMKTCACLHGRVVDSPINWKQREQESLEWVVKRWWTWTLHQLLGTNLGGPSERSGGERMQVCLVDLHTLTLTIEVWYAGFQPLLLEKNSSRGLRSVEGVLTKKKIGLLRLTGDRPNPIASPFWMYHYDFSWTHLLTVDLYL